MKMKTIMMIRQSCLNSQRMCCIRQGKMMMVKVIVTMVLLIKMKIMMMLMMMMMKMTAPVELVQGFVASEQDLAEQQQMGL